MNKFSLKLLAILCGIISIYALYPGYIYSDSFDQYQQAITGELTDWHPPIMSLIWRALIFLTGTGSSIYAVFIVSSCVALYFLLEPLKIKYSLPLYAIIFFSPLYFSFYAIVWKDVFLANIVFFCAAIIANHIMNRDQIKVKIKILLIILLLVASMLRANAPFIVAPMIIYIIFPKLNKFKLTLTSIATSLLLLIISGPINHNIFKAKALNPVLSLQVYDLAGMSHFSKKNIIPGDWSGEENNKILNLCYTPVHWDVYMWGKCSFVIQKINRQHLTTTWLKAITENPIAYLKHRISHFNDLLRFIGNKPAYLYHYTYTPGYQSDKQNVEYKLHSLYQKYIHVYEYQPWHFGFIWFALAGGMLISTINSSSAVGRFINVLSFSSLSYIAAYLVVGVASDFRYLLPSIYLILTSIITCLFTKPLLPTSIMGKIGIAITTTILLLGIIL